MPLLVPASFAQSSDTTNYSPSLLQTSTFSTLPQPPRMTTPAATAASQSSNTQFNDILEQLGWSETDLLALKLAPDAFRRSIMETPTMHKMKVLCLTLMHGGLEGGDLGMMRAISHACKDLIDTTPELAASLSADPPEAVVDATPELTTPTTQQVSPASPLQAQGPPQQPILHRLLRVGYGGNIEGVGVLHFNEEPGRVLVMPGVDIPGRTDPWPRTEEEMQQRMWGSMGHVLRVMFFPPALTDFRAQPGLDEAATNPGTSELTINAYIQDTIVGAAHTLITRAPAGSSFVTVRAVIDSTSVLYGRITAASRDRPSFFHGGSWLSMSNNGKPEYNFIVGRG